MSEPKQKEMDIKSGHVPAGGEIFYIQYFLSTTRYVEYLKQLPQLTFQVDFRGLYSTLSEIYMVCSSGNDMIFAIQQSREKALNQLNAIKRFDENEVPAVIRFCALFLNRSGEDISKYDPILQEEKATILHNEGYDISFFFQLMINLTDGFSAAYLKMKSLSEAKDQEVEIRI